MVSQPSDNQCPPVSAQTDSLRRREFRYRKTNSSHVSIGGLRIHQLKWPTTHSCLLILTVLLTYSIVALYTKSMDHISCRLPPSIGIVLEKAESELDMTRSALIRDALRHYIATNPDDYVAFRGVVPGNRQASNSQGSDDGQPKEPLASFDGVYDPTKNDIT